MGVYEEWARRKKARIDAKDSLITQLRATLEWLKNMTMWAELDLGASIEVDTEVRYFGLTYRCILAHTKSLTRRPTNSTYWVLVE